MTTDFRALCSELVEQVQRAINNHGLCLEASDALMHRARAALAKPADAPAAVAERPSDEELRDLWSWAAGQDQGPWPTQYHCFARAALARWGRPAAAPVPVLPDDALIIEPAEHTLLVPVAQPVPVSERLPGDALCWWYEPDEDDDGSGYGGSWTLLRIRGAVSCYTHWLPANALPLPAPKGGESQP